MTRACHVTHGHTATRIERIRTLIVTLQARHLMPDEIGEILELGPSGVRKYVKDLGDKLAVARYVDPSPRSVGQPLYRLAMTPEATTEYLASLAAAPVARARASISALGVAQRDPSRRFHILEDDTHYSVRVSRTPAARDPLVAAFFGAKTLEARV